MKRFLRLVCLLLVISLAVVLPVNAQDSSNTRASAYIASHSLSIYKTGTYQFKVWFDVVANAQMMDEIGVSEIIIYRSPDGDSWYEVATYTMDDYPDMIKENASNHTGEITYSNATGKYYKAYVTFYAKKGSGSGEISRYTEELQMR